MKKITTFCFLAFIVILVGGVYGCADQNKNIESDSSSADEDDNVAYNVNGYEERLRQKRVPVEGYAEQYPDEIKVVAGADYQNLHFDGALFEDFPETDRLELMTSGQEEISVEDMLEIMEDWLEKTGKADTVDLKSELLFDNLNHPYIELDEDKALVDIGYEAYWPLFYDYISDLKYGTGAMLIREDCFATVTQNGIDYMSDGKLSAYLNEKGIPVSARDILSVDSLGTEVVNGKIEDLAEKSYPLLDGELSVGEGADIVERFFAEDTGRIPREGMHVEAEDVTVYQLEDICCYKYAMRRYYYGIPIVRVESGNYNFYGNYNVDGGAGEAYLADQESVTAYQQINDGEELIPLLSEDSLIGVADAAEILTESLASQIDVSVNMVELAYVAFCFESSENPYEKIYFPCWRFSGTNRVKNENIELFVDVLTGDVYYYTFSPAERWFDLDDIQE